MVVRLKNPFYSRIFHEINHPAIGVPALFQTPIYKLYVETTLLFILQGFIQWHSILGRLNRCHMKKIENGCDPSQVDTYYPLVMSNIAIETCHL